MTIYQTELNDWPEFTEFLISVCQENVGYNENVVAIELITDESNWKDGITGFDIRCQVLSRNRMYFDRKTVDTWNSPRNFDKAEAGIKAILRERQLERLGI